MSAHTHNTVFLLYSYLNMGRTSSLGMGYRFSEMNKRLTSASDSNIVARLASRSITGHELPIQVHQHYGLELHLIRHPNDSKETCIHRAFRTYHISQDECLQLEKSAFQGLCSCIYGESRDLTVFDKVEWCLRARPFEEGPSKEEFANWMWEQKFYQDCMEKQRDVFSCRQVEDYYDLIG